MRVIRRLELAIPSLPKRKRVAGYARVSLGKEAMLHSLSAQISYYSDFIQRNREWEYAGVYADEALTGTKDERPEFQRMLSDCRRGLIDMVVTKSIARFARNTVTMLNVVRELKALNIDVFFEKENIHSLSGDGELMLSILASYAQEESRSVSENCKWRVRKQYADGRLSSTSMLGYKLVDGTLEIIPEEAETVRRIFSDFLGGMGRVAIAERLNAEGIKTKRGGTWFESAILQILRNEKYMGDLLLQKSFIIDHIDKKRSMNRGQLPRYYVEKSHDPIIDRETFEQVQVELERRGGKCNPSRKPTEKYPFSGKIVCQGCGKHYRRKVSHPRSPHENVFWICSSFNKLGKEVCPSKQIPEDTLMKVSAEVLGLPNFDAAHFALRIAEIRVPDANRLIFILQSGQTVERVWEDRSRSKSWTDDMRQQARERKLESDMRRRNT